MDKLVNAAQHRGHHEGHYRLRKDGRWDCQFTLPDGKAKSVYGKSRPDVRAKMDETLDKARKGIDPKGERQTLAQFLDAWLTETQRPKLRPSTIKSYESYIRTHIAPRLGDKTLGELSAQDVQRFLNECTGRGLSPRSVQYIRAILRAALGQALRWGYVERNVAALASPPRQKPKQIETLTADEAGQIMEATRDDRLGALFATALYTGMRQGELLGLRWPDVDLEAGIVRVRQAVQKFDGAWQFVEPKSANGRRTIMEILGHSQITLTLGTYCPATNAMFDEAAGALARALGGAK